MATRLMVGSGVGVGGDGDAAKVGTAVGVAGEAGFWSEDMPQATETARMTDSMAQ